MAHHTEGEVVATTEDPNEAVLTAGLQYNPSLLVIPGPSLRRWPWQLALVYSSALELPDTLLLIVP